MPVYAFAVLPLVLMLVEAMQGTTTISAAFADDITASGTLNDLRKPGGTYSVDLRPDFGYYPEPSKSWIIAKENSKDKAEEIFKNSKVNVTIDGKRHLGAVIGMKGKRADSPDACSRQNCSL